MENAFFVRKNVTGCGGKKQQFLFNIKYFPKKYSQKFQNKTP